MAFVAAGHLRRAAVRHFGVNDSFAVKLLQRVSQLGTQAPGRQGRPPRGGRLEACSAFLIAMVEAKPDITMRNWRPGWRQSGKCRPIPPCCHASCADMASHIKKALMASECARADIREDRNAWREHHQPRMRLEPHRLVFVDETSVNTKMVRLSAAA